MIFGVTQTFSLFYCADQIEIVYLFKYDALGLDYYKYARYGSENVSDIAVTASFMCWSEKKNTDWIMSI